MKRKMKDEHRNIPTITTKELMEEEVLDLAIKIKEGSLAEDDDAIFLWGPPGIGKSAVIKQLAERLEKETGKKVVVTDIRLTMKAPQDLGGIPVADAKKEYTVYLKPKEFALDPSDDVVNLIFLDELPNALPAVMVIASQIIQERRVGEHVFPDNCIFFGAGNRIKDNCAVYEMTNQLANRMGHYEVLPDFESWKEWAVNHGINEYVLGYLSYDNSKLFENGERGKPAFATPRSWEKVSRYLNRIKDIKTPEQAYKKIASYIGVGNAVEFVAYTRVYQQLPQISYIFKGFPASHPKTPDVLFALISSMTAYIQERGTKISEKELGNACGHVIKNFPPDYISVFFRNIIAMDGMNLVLMKIPEFRKWMSKNKTYIG